MRIKGLAQKVQQAIIIALGIFWMAILVWTVKWVWGLMQRFPVATLALVVGSLIWFLILASHEYRNDDHND